jgi:2-polyprenyl-3-methyl-5-hydroxy-6-metoxy-1,4-benzoquinol methylase
MIDLARKVLRKIINYFPQFLNDEEFTSVKKIVNETPLKKISEGSYTELMAECDSVFTDRLKRYPIALKLDFWKNHFELESLKHYPEINGHVLDFGCGSGHLDIFLAQKGWTITGIDASPIGIAIANYNKERLLPDISSRLEFLEIDITKPNLTNLKFDSVWSTQVFEHLSNPKEIIDGVKQYVKDGAFFLICVPFNNAYPDPGHVNLFYSEKDFEDFLSPFLKIIRINIDYKFSVIRALCQF